MCTLSENTRPKCDTSLNPQANAMSVTDRCAHARDARSFAAWSTRSSNTRRMTDWLRAANTRASVRLDTPMLCAMLAGDRRGSPYFKEMIRHALRNIASRTGWDVVHSPRGHSCSN